jgi:ribosomal protein L12E/L44/L45/RPP1/RPP2
LQKVLKDKNLDDLLLNVGGGSGGAPQTGNVTEEKKPEVKKEEEVPDEPKKEDKPESDDMGFNFFDAD